MDSRLDRGSGDMTSLCALTHFEEEEVIEVDA
jgi:hypothetical protein